jgi:arsenate reductase
MSSIKHKVLFVCIQNSARSQMAEAFLKLMGGENFDVESAGIEPGKLNHNAVDVMQEIGIDISNNQPKDVFTLFRQGKMYQAVITVCDSAAAERCPIFRDEIKEKVTEFINEASEIKYWIKK